MKRNGSKPGKESGKLPPFVALIWDLLNSRAYKELSHTGAKVLPFFLGKNKLHIKHEDYYRRPFVLTYVELKRVAGLSTATSSRVIKELVKLGFVDPVSKGGLRGCGGTCNEFCLSSRWRDYGTSNFKEEQW